MMAPHIEQDSELFTNYIAAKTITADGTFVALKDRNNRPALITIEATAGVLHLYTEVDGRLVDHDFGAACGIHDPIQAFAARQQPDQSIFLVIASKSSSTAPIDFCVLPSIKPIDLLSVPTYGRITTSFPFQKISKIALSDYDGTTIDGHTYPDILVVETPSASLQIDDCKILQIVPQPNSTPTVRQTPWTLPFETDQVVDVAFGHSKIGDGVFVLFKDLNDTGVAFVTYGSVPYCNVIKCPFPPSCLTSYIDAKGHSNLLIAGSAIQHYTPAQYIKKNDPGTKLPGYSGFSSVASMHVAQHETDLTIWFTTADNAAGYYHTSHASNVDQSEIVPLLPSGQGNRLSGMLMNTSTGSVVQAINTLIAVGSDNKVSYLTQASKGGAWTMHPLTVSSASELHPVPSYTTRICIKDDDSSVPRATFRLKSTGRVDAIMNGQNVTIEEGGSIFEANATGEATFVVPANDMASFTFDVSDVYTSDKRRLEMNVVNIDPGIKSRTKLATLSSAQKLKDATLPDGRHLIPAGISTDDLKQGAENINNLLNHAMKLTSASAFASQSKQVPPGFSLSPKAWFHWAKSQVDKAIDWGYKLEQGIATFAMKIGNDLLNFALDSIHAVGQAVSWVMKKLKAGWDDLMQWLDLFFHWGDIKDAKHSFKAFVNAGIEFCISEVQTAEQKLDEFFNNLQSQFKTGVQAPSDQGGGDGLVPKWLSEILSSVKFTWVIDQLLSAGGLFGWPIDFPDDDLLDQAWKTMGSVCEDSFQALKLIEQSFLDNFKTISKTPSAKDPLSLVRQLLGIALNAAKTMADGIMDVVTIFLQWLKKYLNSEIQIPIFTKLFHTIGLPLPSVLDIICLIMAIPSTYACKAMRGKVLPNIKGLMERNPNGGTIKQYIEGTLRQQDQRDINLVAGMGSLVLGVLGAGIGAVILALDADPESVVVTQRKTLASSSFSTRHHMLGDPVLFNSPAARIFHGPKVATANTVCQFVNCFMGLTNVFLAFPIKLQSVVWLKWTNWGFMVGRWIVGLIVLGVGMKTKLSVVARNIIAGVDLFLATCQFGSQMVLFAMADETWSQREQQIRTSIFYLLGTLGRSFTVWFMTGELEEAAAATIAVYGFCQVCTAGLQIQNLLNVINSWKLDITIEWVENGTDKVVNGDGDGDNVGAVVVANNKANAQELYWFPWSTVF